MRLTWIRYTKTSLGITFFAVHQYVMIGIIQLTPGTNLVGTDGIPGFFFVFSDLAVRTEGIYTLKFTLFDLAGYINYNPEPSSTGIRS